MRSALAAAACVGAFVTLACDDATAPGGPVSGRWQLDSTRSTFTTPLTVTLAQHDTVIDGDGTFGGTTPKQVAVIGFYSSAPIATPVILTFAAVNTIPAILFGKLSANGDTLSGEYRWTYGLPPDTVTFVRY